MTITAIQQGDKYFLPVRIKEGDTYITNENCDDCRIKIGSFLDAWKSGELGYGEITVNNASVFVWEFPVTQDRSLAWNSGEVPMQVQFKRGETIRGSQTKRVWIDTSVITEEW